MKYDNWKLETPEEELENNCGFCGNPCNDYFCSDTCNTADVNENCRE